MRVLVLAAALAGIAFGPATAAEEGGRYRVVMGAPVPDPAAASSTPGRGHVVILVDTLTGRTWRMNETGDQWRPMPFASAQTAFSGIPLSAFRPTVDEAGIVRPGATPPR